MSGNLTFAMIKPDAVGAGNIGNIIAQISRAGFRISAMRMLRLSKEEAGRFYLVHKERPFYQNLIQFMSSGHIVAMIAEKDNAVKDFRKLIGATNPEEAEEGTIRKSFATNVERNAVHGSDSDENAVLESSFFFSQIQRF